MESNKYIKKWLEGSLTEEERLQFEATEDYRSLKKLLNSVSSFKAPGYDQEKELTKLLKKRSRESKHIQLSWIRPLLRVAAVLVVLITATFYFYVNKTTSVETVASEKMEIYLPDSSFVQLNASSTISYKKNRWDENRSLKLDGEAFFEVHKGSRFDVETKMGTVSVLGTSFNVKSRPSYFEVVCYEGLVQVSNQNEVTKLEPGNSFRLLNGKVESFRGLTAHGPAWLDNESSFISVPLDLVFLEFERQYNVSVNKDGIDTSRLFTGRFPNNNITLALQVITEPFGLEFKFEKKNLVIISK